MAMRSAPLRNCSRPAPRRRSITVSGSVRTAVSRSSRKPRQSPTSVSEPPANTVLSPGEPALTGEPVPTPASRQRRRDRDGKSPRPRRKATRRPERPRIPNSRRLRRRDWSPTWHGAAIAPPRRGGPAPSGQQRSDSGARRSCSTRPQSAASCRPGRTSPRPPTSTTRSASTNWPSWPRPVIGTQWPGTSATASIATRRWSGNTAIGSWLRTRRSGRPLPGQTKKRCSDRRHDPAPAGRHGPATAGPPEPSGSRRSAASRPRDGAEAEGYKAERRACKSPTTQCGPAAQCPFAAIGHSRFSRDLTPRPPLCVQ